MFVCFFHMMSQKLMQLGSPWFAMSPENSLFWAKMSRFSFVRSFVLCGQMSSLLWTPYGGRSVRFPRERKGIGRCVRCVFATCREGGLILVSSLSCISIATPSRRGLLSGLALTGAVYYASERPAKSIYFDSRRVEPRPLSASRSTAHDGWVR